ncbi:hypothetical protein V8C42DRAFT_37213 [Trichoderma barbatum]
MYVRACEACNRVRQARSKPLMADLYIHVSRINTTCNGKAPYGHLIYAPRSGLPVHARKRAGPGLSRLRRLFRLQVGRMHSLATWFVFHAARSRLRFPWTRAAQQHTNNTQRHAYLSACPLWSDTTSFGWACEWHRQ